jgi:hypothetical protein
MKNVFGVFRAIVTDVSMFENTGKIKTRISLNNHFFIEKDLLDNFNAEEHKKKVEYDSYTYIMSPFGGGSNYGMFKLPPVNSVGLVSFIDGNSDTPVWIGGLPGLIFGEDGNIVYSDIPSDKLNQEKSFIDFNNENNKNEKNYDDINSLVIRTKTNDLDLNNPESINWKNNLTENGLVMNKNHMYMVHKKDENISGSIEIDNNDNYSIGISHLKKEENVIQEESSIYLGKKGITERIVDSENGKVIQIEATDKVRITVSIDNKTTEITQTKSGITLESNNCSVQLNQKASGKDEIILSAPVIRIDSPDLLIGSGGDRVVTASGPFSMSLEDGTILNTAKNVRI